MMCEWRNTGFTVVQPRPIYPTDQKDADLAVMEQTLNKIEALGPETVQCVADRIPDDFFPPGHMKVEINQILPRAKKPGEALALLSYANPWSLNVSSPSRLTLPDQRSIRGASVEKVLEKYVFSLFFKDRVPKRQRRPTPTRTSTHSIPARPSDEIPAAWMLPPTYVMRPLVHG
jgi:hypothetical protein